MRVTRARWAGLAPANLGFGQILLQHLSYHTRRSLPASPRGTKLPPPGIPAGSGSSSSAPARPSNGLNARSPSRSIRDTPLRPSTSVTAGAISTTGAVPCRSTHHGIHRFGKPTRRPSQIKHEVNPRRLPPRDTDFSFRSAGCRGSRPRLGSSGGDICGSARCRRARGSGGCRSLFALTIPVTILQLGVVAPSAFI